MRRTLRTLLEAMGVVAAGLAALTTALAWGGAVERRLDVFAHFAPFYLASGVLLVVLALLLRSRAMLALSLAAALGGGGLMAPDFLRPAGPTAPADAPGQIKVVQLNALETNARIDLVADWLIAQNPDVVTITEARHDLRDLLLRRAGWRLSGAKGSLMIFTQERRLAMNRPKPGAHDHLAFVNATYPSASGPFEVVTAHLDWPTRDTHALQEKELAGVVRRLPTNRMILTGDFNAAPWSFAFRRMERDLGLIRRDTAVTTYPTWRGPHPFPMAFLAIDHVFAGPGWATVSVTRGPDGLGSDHYPLIVVLAPVGPA